MLPAAAPLGAGGTEAATGAGTPAGSPPPAKMPVAKIAPISTPMPPVATAAVISRSRPGRTGVGEP